MFSDPNFTYPQASARMKSARLAFLAMLVAALAGLVGCVPANAPQAGNTVQQITNRDAYSSYESLRDRFNRQLGGRYPFGGLDAPDAEPADVKAFFADYAAHASALKSALGMSKDPRATDARKFLAQLDKSALFLSDSLLAGEPSQPLMLDPAFRLMPMAAPGSEQVVSWKLESGQRASMYPGRAATGLEWNLGQPIRLDLVWASGSAWRPEEPKMALTPDYTVVGRTASFSADGAWALLRFIERHRPSLAPDTDPQNARRVLLEFRVPTRRALNSTTDLAGESNEARLYLGLTLVAVDPRTRERQTIVWPGGFVRSAP